MKLSTFHRVVRRTGAAALALVLAAAALAQKQAPPAAGTPKDFTIPAPK